MAGATGTTAVHLCFGYAARVSVKPSGYSFLPELNACKADQISIETAQPKLDCAILAELPRKTIILGVLDLGDMTVESPATVAARVRRALAYVAPERIVLAPDCGMKYLPRDVAFGKLAAMAQAAAILRRSQRDAGFAVLLAPDVPAVLLEMGFITNPDDEAVLADPERRGRMVDAIADAVDDYFAADGGATSVAALP